MKIIVENSTWNNLGDGFYQFTLEKILKYIFPESKIFYGEGPVKRAFHPNRFQYSNALRINETQSADLHVFSGPILMSIDNVYGKVIKNIIAKGDNYALLSVSCSGLSGNRLNQVCKFLSDYPPILFSSRDPETFRKFKSCIKNPHDGICTAFLVDEFLDIDKLTLENKYFISSFYKRPEPLFLSKTNTPKIDDIILKKSNSVLDILPYKISRHLQIYRKAQSSLGHLKIVRAVQQISNKSNNFNFKHPNSFITMNPLIMLSVYKGAEFTISERVHSCAVTLAFGKSARILIDNPRNGIFEKVGFDWRKNKGIMIPNNLTKDSIKTEKEKLVRYIKSI